MPSAGPGEAPFTVFLDRDGVFNPDPDFGLRSARPYTLLPGAAEAHARLKAAGMRTCLVTNQPWVAMLTATPGMIRRVHAELRRRLRDAGADLDRVEVSYAPPVNGARWGPFRRRKPNPGMLEDAAAAWRADGEGFDPSRAVMVGDTWRDAGAAHNFGVRCILLATTHAPEELARRVTAHGFPVPEIVSGLPEATQRILALASAASAAASTGPAAPIGPPRMDRRRARDG